MYQNVVNSPNYHQGAFRALRPEDLRCGVSFPIGVDIA